MKQQADLAESMKAIGPLMKNMEPLMLQAKEMMSSMNDGQSGLGNIMGIANELSKKMGVTAPK